MAGGWKWTGSTALVAGRNCYLCRVAGQPVCSVSGHPGASGEATRGRCPHSQSTGHDLSRAALEVRRESEEYLRGAEFRLAGKQLVRVSTRANGTISRVKIDSLSLWTGLSLGTTPRMALDISPEKWRTRVNVSMVACCFTCM